MDSPDEIDLLISKMLDQKIKGYDRIKNYLSEKDLSLERQAEYYKRLQDNYGDAYTIVITRWISDNMKALIDTYPRSLLSILESRARKNYLDSALRDIQKLETTDLHKMYNLANRMNSEEDKIISGYFLGEIGVRENEYLMKEILRISDADDEKKISCLKALVIGSNRFRNRKFVLTEAVSTLILEYSKSANEKLSSQAIFTYVVLFEYDTRFKDAIAKYFFQSAEHQYYVYRCLDSNDLSDQDFELSLLAKGSASESIEELKTLMWVLGSKIFRSHHPTNRFLDMSRIQLFTLDFIRDVFSRSDIQLQQLLSSSLFTDVGNLDIDSASRYLIGWITNEPINPVKHQFIYSKLISDFFQDHETRLLTFLSLLWKEKENYYVLIAYVIGETISNLEFERYFRHHNKTVPRDLKRMIRNPLLQARIENLVTKNLDNLKTKMREAIEIIDNGNVSVTDPSFAVLQNLRKELERKIEYFARKIAFIENCEMLLVDMCIKRQFFTEKLTKNYSGKSIRNIVKRCEILRGELSKTKKEEVKFDDIKIKLSSFPNIEKHFGYDWLNDKCREGYPYHHIVSWLSIIVEKKELEKIVELCAKQNDPYLREIESRKLRRTLWALAWLNHVETCLGFFVTGKEQGKRIVIDGLKEESNFFQFLTQLEIGLKLQVRGYKVDLEVKSDGKRIDILAMKGAVEKIFELYTFDLYAEIKYSGFSANVPDRTRSVVFSKIRDQISVYAKTHSGPMFIILNLTHAYDTDLHGVIYALRGSDIDHFEFDGGEIVNRFTSFQRDQEFLNLEQGKKLTAVIHCTNEFDGMSIKLQGKIIPNESAEIKLDVNDILEIEQDLFEN